MPSTADTARRYSAALADHDLTTVRGRTAANVRTRVLTAIHGVSTEQVASGVWLVRGGFPIRTINVYLIEEDDGLTVFDAGIAAMGPALQAVCARMGPIKRVVLGHADADHRGAAPALGAPVHCHAAERAAAESSLAMRHPAFDADVEQARASIRKLAALDPSAVWAGHADPVTGDVRGQLGRAAAAPLP